MNQNKEFIDKGRLKLIVVLKYIFISLKFQACYFHFLICLQAGMFFFCF